VPGQRPLLGDEALPCRRPLISSDRARRQTISANAPLINLNRVQSSRRLEREAGRNVELMWLTSRLVPHQKTIADFRRDNGKAIRQVCARLVALCRTMGLFADRIALLLCSKVQDDPSEVRIA